MYIYTRRPIYDGLSGEILLKNRFVYIKSETFVKSAGLPVADVLRY